MNAGARCGSGLGAFMRYLNRWIHSYKLLDVNREEVEPLQRSQKLAAIRDVARGA